MTRVKLNVARYTYGHLGVVNAWPHSLHRTQIVRVVARVPPHPREVPCPGCRCGAGVRFGV